MPTQVRLFAQVGLFVFTLVLSNVLLAQNFTTEGVAESWPRFRGPTGMGVTEVGSLPLRWSTEENIVWQTSLPGAGTSSPITYGNRIYVTSYSGYAVPGEAQGNLQELKRHLVAIDRRTGEMLWSRTEPAAQPEEPRIRDHGYAANSPVVGEEGVYVFYGASGVIAYDHQGKERWRTQVGSGTHGWGSGASLVLHDELLFVNASVESEALVALERASGRERWRAEGIRESWNTPLVIQAEGGREELVLARFGDVLAFAPENGKPLWSCKTDISWYIVPTLVEAEGVVYCFGGRSGITALAVRSGGESDVTQTHRLWTKNFGTNVPSPLVKDGYLFWFSHDGGIAYCAQAETGDVVFRQRIDGMGQVYASPLLAGDRIYCTDRSGKTFVTAAKPEFELLATNSLEDGSRFDASPGISGSHILIRSGSTLYCLGD